MSKFHIKDENETYSQGVIFFIQITFLFKQTKQNEIATRLLLIRLKHIPELIAKVIIFPK